MRLCGAISSLSLDVSPLNLVSYLVFKALLQQCRWIFAYCSLSKLVRIYYVASVSEKNDRRTCSQQKLVYWRVIYSQNSKEMFEESIDSVTKDLLRLKKKKIPANQRIIQPLFITSRRFVSLAKRSSSSGKRWACDISACWNRCVECLLVLWVSKTLWNRHRKNTIFFGCNTSTIESPLLVLIFSFLRWRKRKNWSFVRISLKHVAWVDLSFPKDFRGQKRCPRVYNFSLTWFLELKKKMRLGGFEKYIYV